MEKNPDGTLKVHLRKKAEGGVDVIDNVNILIWAIGRDPNLKALNIEKVGIELKGPFIKVDKYQTTSKSNIYAVGDVIGKYQLTPGIIAFDYFSNIIFSCYCCRASFSTQTL